MREIIYKKRREGVALSIFLVVMALVFLVSVGIAGSVGETIYTENNSNNLENVTFWLEKGNFLYNQSMYNESIQAYDKCIEIDPQNALAWYNKGISLGNLGRYEEALQACNKSIELDPQYALAWSNKGAVLINLGRYEEALQACNKSIELDPQYALAWYNKGTSLINLGKYEEALQACNKSIELDPQNALTWSNKGTALVDLGRYEEALQAFNKSIELDPQYALTWSNKGAALINLGRYEEALQACNKSIELDPQYALAWNNKGTSLGNLGKYEEALQAYNKSMELDPQNALALNNKDLILGYLGREENVSNSTTVWSNSNLDSNATNSKSAISINNTSSQINLDGIGTFTVLSSIPPVGTKEEINKWYLYVEETHNYTNGTKDYRFDISLKANSFSDMEGKGFRIQLPNNEVVSVENIQVSQKSPYELTANYTGEISVAYLQIGDQVMAQLNFETNQIKLWASPLSPTGSGPYAFIVSGNFNLSGK